MMPHKESGIPYIACAAGFHNWERVMVQWLEKNGYGVDCATNSDLEFHPELLRKYRLMLSVGHDEYWSWVMRDTVESFISGGGNVCFFSGNTCYWQIRFEDQGRTMICYRKPTKDPYFQTDKKHLTTTRWSNHHIGRPETRITGLSFHLSSGALGLQEFRHRLWRLPWPKQCHRPLRGGWLSDSH
jgi:hypothetical protein